LIGSFKGREIPKVEELLSCLSISYEKADVAPKYIASG
jgi:hypothetical protein